MNTNLKKLAKGKIGVNLLLMVLLVFLTLVGVAGLIGEIGGGSEAKPFSGDCEEGDRAYVEAQYASEYFAYFESNESDKLYFLMDEQFGACIVCISDSDIGTYADLQAYTFGEIETVPAKVRAEGTLMLIDDSLMQLAIEEFNGFIGENAVTAQNCHEYFGYYYIDTAMTNVSSDYLIFVVLIVLMVVLAVLLVKKNRKTQGESKTMLAALEASGESAVVDAELQDADTKQYKKLGVYLTQNYVVSSRNGLKVIALSEISGLYGVVTEKNYELVARKSDEKELVIVQTESKVNKQWDELLELVAAISERTTDMEYGVDRVKVEGPFDVTQIEHFFVGRNKVSALEVQTEMTNADGTVLSPNYSLGIIGAIAGALVGGVLWVIIGKLGYIAGIAGFVTIYLAAMGFKKCAKVLTRGGAVIAVVISVIVIFAANYVLYAWMMVEAFGGRFTMTEMLMTLFPALSEYELVGSFVKDMVIGYGLSLVAAFSTLKTLFGKK